MQYFTIRKLWVIGLLIVSITTINSCSTLNYYSQAVHGHLKLLKSREEISEVIASDSTDDVLKKKLSQALLIRQFASEKLGLPDNDSYKSFVKTGKKYITWNVIAASEFSLQAKTWCFPVAGCVSYKGYFSEKSANNFANQLSSEGYDTAVTGATAYSTIGWFDDPILDTMLNGRETRLAGLIFHELAHQQLYVKGDSDFNEAFASFVEQQGVRNWLVEKNDAAGLQRYQNLLDRRKDFSDLLLSARIRLQTVYASSSTDSNKRIDKQSQFETLRQEYLLFKSRWDGFSGYDGWFSQELNNANLVASATYRRLVPAFTALYKSADQNMKKFYEEANNIAQKDKQERENVLAGLLLKLLP